MRHNRSSPLLTPSAILLYHVFSRSLRCNQSPRSSHPSPGSMAVSPRAYCGTHSCPVSETWEAVTLPSMAVVVEVVVPVVEILRR